MGIKVFLLTQAARKRIELRRYANDDAKSCPRGWGFHNADKVIDEIDAPIIAELPDSFETNDEPKIPHDDPRWPIKCDACAYEFKPNDEWQVNDHRLYSGAPDGKLYTLRDAPIGAAYFAWWLHHTYEGKVHCLYWKDNCHQSHVIVKLPPDGWDWDVDSRASNCTMKDDVVHRCWVKHGSLRDGTFHVDKNGVTCSAGAGSILTPRWHGFLHNGELVT